jgi:hypothetical protein
MKSHSATVDTNLDCAKRATHLPKPNRVVIDSLANFRVTQEYRLRSRPSDDSAREDEEKECRDTCASPSEPSQALLCCNRNHFRDLLHFSSRCANFVRES